MRPRSRISALMILAAAFFCGSVARAGAEDFTFNIPIELHKINANIKSGFIRVEVYTKDYEPKLIPDNDPLRRSSKIASRDCFDFEIVNGEYVDTVTLSLNAPDPPQPGKQAQDAFYYEVLLILQDTYYHDTGGIGHMLDNTSRGYGYDASKPFVYWTSGLVNPLKVIPKRMLPKKSIIK